MKNRKQKLQAALLCESLGAEDGVDPRDQRNRKSRSKRGYHEDQVARQAERALSTALSGSTDPVLQVLDVSAVSFAGNSLNVSIALLPDLAGNNLFSRSEIEQALRCASGHLRCVVGDAITRKRVPRLVFSVCDQQGVTHD